MAADARQDFRKQNLPKWGAFLRRVFPLAVPNSCEWHGLSEIIAILDALGKVDALNHTFFPRSGGADIKGCVASVESACIELSLDTVPHILKPSRLLFDWCGADLEWAYFRLETSELPPSGIYGGGSFECEEVTELSPGNYLDRSVWESGYYGQDENGDDLPLPESARFVCRYSSGSFVTFAKGSAYNQVPGTYDGRHNQMSVSDFSSYIRRSAEQGRPRA